MKGRGLALGAWLALGAAACSGPARHVPTGGTIPATSTEPRWQDAIDPHPDLLLAVRPRELVAHPLYGSLLRRALELAREHDSVVDTTGVLDALRDADEALVAVNASASAGRDDSDIVAVLLGVRGDIDPAHLCGDDGKPLWEPGPSGGVRELLRDKDGSGVALGASLFELPGRTWVVASGDARERVREVFARPKGRADPTTIAPSTLAFARLDGRAFVAHVAGLAPPSPLAPLGRHLLAIAIELVAGAEIPLHASLSYAAPEDAAAARAVASDTIDALRRKRPEGLAWLGDATVAARDPKNDREVMFAAPLPPEVVRAFEQLSASGRHPSP